MLQAGSGAGLLVETDTSPVFLARARERSTGRSVFCSADAAALPFRSGAFDALAAMAVLHCFDDEAIPVIMAEARRVLARGGRLVLAEDWAFADPSPCEALAEAVRFGEPGDREHHRDSAAWREILEGSGFSVSFSGWAPRPFDPLGTPAGREGRLDPGVLARLPARPFVRMLVLEGMRL
jgi:SAM-dependent methyltransferase